MNTWWPETRLNYRTQIFMKSSRLNLRASVLGGQPLGPEKLARKLPLLQGYASWAWQQKETWAVLAGLWWGAATHTFADVGVSVARKASEIF